MFRVLVAFLIAATCAAGSMALAQQPRTVQPPTIETGSLPVSWPTGATCPEPDFRTHQYNSSVFILRQSGCTNFEKPFLYLIVGRETTLLVDTGAPTANIASAIAELRTHSATRNGRLLPLVAVHSHGHGDHTAGDEQLSRLPLTTVVAAAPDALQKFFHFSNWPTEIRSYDLGERVIDVIPIPGHERASIAIYDRKTGLLFTGDTLYPGRLYIRDAVAFEASIRRLVDFTADKVVAHVLGAHIENARMPYVDYPEGTKSQPDEHALELGRAHLLELQTALREMNGHITQRVFRDFTIWPLTDPAR
jgi:glyoxylase-like metal-dependent hydrolase (beta-lactamase superfamily II)